MTIGDRLRGIRKENRYSQEEFGEIMNVSRQAISKWESNEMYPEVDKLIKISNFFKVSLDSILKGETVSCENKIVCKEAVDRGKIIEFLCKAKKETYAGSKNKVKSSRPSSHDLEYSEKNLKYIDSYVGSEKFIGEEVLFIDDIPYWAMNYSGRVIGENFSGSFLKEVLSRVNKNNPYRGENVYVKGDYKYQTMVNGDFEWFNGGEEIYFKNEKIYECIFHGGIIK